MPERHSLLRRQIRRHLGIEKDWPEGWRLFIDAIDQAYHASDADRSMIERSLELSSQELLQANSEMRALFSAFPDLFFCIDTSGTILHCNAGRQAGSHLSPDRLRGKRIQDIPVPGVARQFEAALGDVARTGTTVRIEYELNDGGLPSYYEARMLPMPGPQIGVFIRDITLLKSAENALKLTQFAIEHLSEAAYWMTPDARFFYVNGTASEHLGYTRAELLTMSVFDIDPTFLTPAEWPRHWEELKRRKAFTFEAEHRTKAGKTIPVEISINFVVFEGKEYNCSFARDISESRALELAARRSEKMSAVGQLAAGVAHEINNPLTVILGFAQSLLRRLRPGDPHIMPLASIEREALRCRNLANSLLSFSRDKKSGTSPTDPRVMMSEALALVEVQAKTKKIRLVREESKDLPHVNMNADQIQQVVINLCANAMDAMPDGGTLTVAMAVRGDRLELRVTDTGTGIARDVRERIFDPFFTTKPVGKGTGLGLSLTYEIVRSHRGRIELESELGRGTQFMVSLPLTPSLDI